VSYYLFFCFFLVGFYVMFFYHFHYMLLLLGLELILLSVFVLFRYGLSGFLVSWCCFVFLLVLVCMGGFGISLVVSLARCCGRDFWFGGFLL
jgi:hypothetical protein